MVSEPTLGSRTAKEQNRTENSFNCLSENVDLRHIHFVLSSRPFSHHARVQCVIGLGVFKIQIF